MSAPSQDIRSLEHPTLKVPYENLNKRFRLAQKTMEREASHVQGAATDLEKALKEPEDAAGIPQMLGTLMDRVKSLEERTRESVDVEIAAANLCKTRLEHLKQGCKSSGGQLGLWKKTRVDRMLVEHFLRSGFYNSAIKLAETTGITELTNINIFLVAKDVEESLALRDTGKCLSWCHDNKSKLRKMKSTLEFNVRLQEYVELVKQGRKMDAVRHARKHLASAEQDNSEKVQTAMALLAFPADTVIGKYQELFREDRWQRLIEQFRNENYRLFQLSSLSLFSVTMQAGLSALKTQRCSKRPPPTIRSQSDRNSECPVCQDPLYDLAQPLPFAHCSQSRLVCHISGEPLDENNQPRAFPNGFVYGEKILKKMAQENNGKIICPRSKEEWSLVNTEKVYVM